MTRLLALILLSTPSAHAIVPQNGTRVEAKELILVGAGIQARRAKDSIALACTDRSCQNLRFVTFHNNKEAYFFGKTFPGVTAESGMDLSQQVEKISDQALSIRNSDHRNHKGRGNIIVITAILGSSAVFAITSFVAPFLIVVGGLAVLQLAEGKDGNSVYQDLDLIGHLRNKKNKVIRIMNQVESTEVFLNQDGWNWTENPRKISRDKFCTAFVAIDHPNYMTNDTDDIHRFWAIRACKEQLK